MHVTLKFDGQSPQERDILRQLETLAQTQPRRAASPFPFSWLEGGVTATLNGLEWLVRRLVCALFR